MLSKSWIFENTFNHSNFNATLVSEPGNFVKPLAHCSFGSENFSIVCEGYHND